MHCQLIFTASDVTFPPPARLKAEEILTDGGKSFHIQVFGGVKHGFAIRCDLSVDNERK